MRELVVLSPEAEALLLRMAETEIGLCARAAKNGLARGMVLWPIPYQARFEEEPPADDLIDEGLAYKTKEGHYRLTTKGMSEAMAVCVRIRAHSYNCPDKVEFSTLMQDAGYYLHSKDPQEWRIRPECADTPDDLDLAWIEGIGAVNIRRESASSSP